MPFVVDSDHLPFVCWGDLHDSRSDYAVLWSDEAIPAQRCKHRYSPPRSTNLTDVGNVLQAALRQMVYLVIKELSSIAEDVIMVTSSIMKDMQPNLEVVYRPNAIRALARIIDVSHTGAGHCGILSLSTKLARRNPYNLPSAFSNQPSWTATLRSPRPLSSPPTIFIRSLEIPSNGGLTKPRRRLTLKQYLPEVCSECPPATSEEVTGTAMLRPLVRSKAPATSCSITPSVCSI